MTGHRYPAGYIVPADTSVPVAIDSLGRTIIAAAAAEQPSDPLDTGAYWTVSLAGFANPKYVAANQDDSTGFYIGDSVAFTAAFENGHTSTVAHEQTLDPTGATGWFPVAGKIANATSSSPTTIGSVSGSAYIFPAVGVRARIRTTALSVADMRVRIARMDQSLDVSTGIVGLATGASVIGSVISSVAEDAAAASTAFIAAALEARNTQKTAMSATGDVVRAVGTMDGKQVVYPNAVPDLSWQFAGIAGGIVSSTADTVVKAALATYRNYITGITIAHDTLGAVTEWVLKDGSTIICRGKLQVAANEGIDLDFPTPLRCTVNTALNFALLTSVTGGVFINAQGYTGV